MNTIKLITFIGFCFCLVGCAATKVDISGTPADQQLCQSRDEQISALVIWKPEWRPDQKDVPLREVAAKRGIERFFSQSGCFSKTHVHRFVGENPDTIPSDPELLKLANSTAPAPDIVVFIKVKELGPVLRIGLPILIEGGTEVVLEVKVLNVRTNGLIAALRTHWQNGGIFVIKGVKTLEQDMS